MTVSRVINGRSNVRETTRKRVLKAIKTLSYRPNAAARALNSSRSYNIGIIFPRKYLYTAPFFIELCADVESHLKQKRYHLFFGSIVDETDPDDLTGIYREGKVDGLILFAPGKDDEVIRRLMANRVPFVVILGRSEKKEFSYVDSNNAKGTSFVMDYLFGLGHRRIGFVAGNMTEINGRDRLRCYRSKLRSYGEPFDKTIVYQGDWSLESGYAAFQSLMSVSRPPTAIFFSNDQMAIGAIKAARDLGVKIPADVSITGYDDIKYASFVTPSLTTVAQDIDAVGREAVELIVEQVEDDVPPRSVILDPTLVIRSSCRAIR